MKPIVQKEYLKLYEETARNRIMELFFKFPEKEFSLSDLAKEANVRKSNIGTIIEQLKSIGFIEIEKLSKIWRIRANRQNWFFLKSKIAYNLSFIYMTGLVEFLNDFFKKPKSIMLFGSFRKGEDISNSDIDIAVESDETDKHQIMGLRELIELENMIGRKIQVHLFNRRNIDTGLFNNIVNGIVLLGFLEVKP